MVEKINIKISGFLLFQSGLALGRWGLTGSDRINNNTVAAHSEARGTEHVWSSTVDMLNLAMAEDNVRQCVCAYRPWRMHMDARAQARGGTHRVTLRPDPPICARSFRKTPKPNSSLSFPITFSSQHRHHTTSIQILPQFLPSSPSSAFSVPLSNASMCYHHKHAAPAPKSHATIWSS